MRFEELTSRAREVRSLYAEWERQRDGRPWTTGELLTGFVGDVGDLAKLVQAHNGVRPGPDDLPAALGHELSDCLWSVLVLADELGIDLQAAFTSTIDELEHYVRDRLD